MLYLSYATLFAVIASAARTPEVPAAGALKMDFAVSRGSSQSSAVRGAVPALLKRDGLAELTITNEQTFYMVSLKVGSQGAENNVLIDTGSSDLWLVSSELDCLAPSSYYKRSLGDSRGVSRRRLMDFERPDFANPDNDKKNAAKKIASSATPNKLEARVDYNACGEGGSFDTAELSSFQVNTTAPEFFIIYADNTYASGFWGTDYLEFGAANISDCSFAVVKDTTSSIGVLGIGLPQLEVTYSGYTATTPYTYENFPRRLKSTGVISRIVYSLYLNSADALLGSVLFGAVDHAKYSGQLQTVPIINRYPLLSSIPLYLDIVLNSITLESSGLNVSVLTFSVAAVLDSGTTFTYLPMPILESFASLLGASISSSGLYKVSCDYDSDDIHAVFNFSGAKIRVPMSDLIVWLGSACYLGLFEEDVSLQSKAGSAVLGDNFLRNAYVVYDLENLEVSLAQVKYTTDEDIEIVTDSVPLAMQADGYSSSSIVSFGTYSTTSRSKSSRTSTTTSTSTTSSSARTSTSSGSRSSNRSSTAYFARFIFSTMVGAGLILVL